MRRPIRLALVSAVVSLAACAPPAIVRDSPYLPPILGGGAAITAQQVVPPGFPPMVPLPVLKADFRSKAGSDTVRFARDSFAINPAAAAILERQAIWLLANPTVRASIEGHADVRQTREYALALGERRAAAVRNFLLTRGVRPDQLEIVSWGRERPAVAAVHDAAFLQNSRVQTVLLRPQPGALLPPFYPPPPPPRN